MYHRAPNAIEEIERYILSGSIDSLCAAWSGNIMERATNLKVRQYNPVTIRWGSAGENKMPGGWTEYLDAPPSDWK